MCTKKCAHEHTGPAESIRPSLRNGLTAYAVLSPETNSSCLRHRRIDDFARPGWACENLRRFDTSNGCQDHTVLPYAASFTKPFDQPCDRPKFWRRRLSAVRLHAVDRSRKTALRTCLRAQRCRVHRIPSQRFVTIAIRPSFKGMRCGSYEGDLGEKRRGIFLGEGAGLQASALSGSTNYPVRAGECATAAIRGPAAYDGSTAPCASIVAVTAKTHRYRFCYIPLQQPRLFGAIERDGDYGSSAVLKPPRDHLG